jgi:hypothetical protein
MSREPARNLAASVRARLLTLAQEKGEDYQRILGKYAVGLHLSAFQSHYPNIFAPYENIGRFSWRRFFRVTDRDSDLLNSKQLMCGNVLRFSCAFLP